MEIAREIDYTIQAIMFIGLRSFLSNKMARIDFNTFLE
jgi:hypothetical protein